jgi:plastocyanin
MKVHRRITPFAALLLVALVALVASCSDKGTNPGGGGGGTKELNSADITPGGGQFPHTFANVGTFPYHCIHHSMTGSVQVVGGAAMSVAVTITDNQFSPSSVSVAPGGTVTWTNNGGSPHTVTSD